MLREPFVSSGRAFFGDESGYARHGTYQRVVGVGTGDVYDPWGTAGARIVSAGGSRTSEAAAPTLGRIEPRYALIDLGRLVCALGVITAHVGGSPIVSSMSDYSHLRLPYFMLLAMFFLFRRAERNSIAGWGEYIRVKAKQLYLPFLAWAFIYFVLKNIKNVFVMNAGLMPLHWEMLLHGNSAHLWFLPDLLVACILAYPVSCWLMRGHRTFNAAMLMAVGMAVALCPAPHYAANSIVPHTIQFTSQHGWSIVPCIAWGLAAALLYPSIREKLGRTTLLLGTVLIGIGVVVVRYYGRVPLFEATAAFGLLLVALTPVNNRIVSAIGKYGRYTYGIYLIHMVFVNTMHTVVAVYLGLKPSNVLDISILLISFFASLGAAILLAKSPRTRWLIASEPATKPRSRALPAVRQPELAVAA